MPLLLLLSLLLLSQDKAGEKLQDKPPEKCSLSGTVVDSVTGEPLNKVALRLEPTSREGGAAGTTTSDSKGHFVMVDLNAGAYRLRGQRSGYLEMHYGAQSRGNNGTILRLDAGQTLSDLNFKLTPAGAIGGTIRDSDGEPIEGARIELAQIAYNNRGRSRLERAGGASSDDRGEYRFRGLSPGKYYVSVAGFQSGWYAGEVDRSASKGPTEASVMTFYPGAPDFSTASPVAVSAGARVAGIDVTLLRRRVVCVSGRVVVPPGTGRLAVSLEAPNADAGNYRASTSAENTTRDFQFCHVPPGAYVLTAYFDKLTGRIPVNVGSVDVNELRVTLSPGGAEIQVQVVAEGAIKPNLKEVYVQISLDGKGQTYGYAREDGSFLPGSFPADHYDIEIREMPRGFYVKSIRSGETDVLADGLTISGPGRIPVEVGLSPDGSELSGVVLDKNQLPVGGATVLLAPDQRLRFDLFKTATSDQSGHYEFAALAPGNYKLFAWDDVEPNQWYDPYFLKDYEKLAEKAALEPKAHTTVNPHLAAPADAR